MTKSADPRRLRWSVPRADVSTNKWLDKQQDISRSLQLLIRESIQRDGYIDVVNRPVEQLPRRGRPQLGETADEQSDPPPAQRQDHHDTMGHPAAAEVARAPDPAQGPEIARDAGDVDTEPSQAHFETAPPRESGETRQAQPQRRPAPDEGPMDMDAIFGNRR